MKLDRWYLTLPLPSAVTARVAAALSPPAELLRLTLDRDVELDPLAIVLAEIEVPSPAKREPLMEALQRALAAHAPMRLEIAGAFPSRPSLKRSLWLRVAGDVPAFERLERTVLDALSRLDPRRGRPPVPGDEIGVRVLSRLEPACDLDAWTAALTRDSFGEIVARDVHLVHTYRSAGRLSRQLLRTFAFASHLTPLEALTTSPDEAARARAAADLAATGTSSLPVLLAALADTSGAVRSAVVAELATLGRTGPAARRTVHPVLARLAHTDPEGAVRAAASRALTALDEPLPDVRLDPDAAFRAQLDACRDAIELEDALVARSRALTGEPLRRVSWQLIARAMADRAGRPRFSRMLAAARTRTDALRVLRLARRLHDATRGGSGGRRPEGPPSGARPDHVFRPSARPDDTAFWDAYFEIEADENQWHQAAWEEYRTMRAGLASPARDPWSPVEAAMRERLDHLVHDRAPSTFASLGARLAPSIVASLRRRIGAPLDVPERVLLLLERHHLDRWPELTGIRAERTPIPVPRRVTHPAELAILSHLDEAGFVPRPAHHVEWELVMPHLAALLARAPADDVDEDLVIRATVATVLGAAPTHLRALTAAMRRLHPRYLALLCLVGLRSPRGLTFGLQRFERAAGSALVPHLVAANLADAARLSEDDMLAAAPEASRLVLRELLVSGGGTLRRAAYPDLRLLSRPALVPIDDAARAQLEALSARLHAWNDAIATAPAATLVPLLLAAHDRDPGPLPASLAPDIERHVIAYSILKTRVFAGEPIRIRRKHIRTFEARPADAAEPPVPATLADLRPLIDGDLLKEALAHALLDHLHTTGGAPPLPHPAKEALIAAARAVALTFQWHDGAPPPPSPPDAPPDSARDAAAVRTFNGLLRRMDNAPLALCDALGIAHQQGIPHLRGGERLPLEQSFRHLARHLTGSFRADPEASQRTLLLRPMPKRAALGRGELAGDCSTTQVPFRALSPHHTYYAIYELHGDPSAWESAGQEESASLDEGAPRAETASLADDASRAEGASPDGPTDSPPLPRGAAQIPGYITVYEAYAHLPDAPTPVLCLETVNIPSGALDGALPDLVRLLESVAASRGLHPHLVVITGVGTYNFATEPLLQHMRRYRRGTPVRLSPADPALWAIYSLVTGEDWRYSAFTENPLTTVRLLAPPDPDKDLLQPENLAAAARLSSRPRTEIRITARRNGAPLAFITQWRDLPP